MTKNRLMVICPAFNEEGRIGPLLRKVKPFADELVVVDDGSSDGTFKEANQETVTILTHLKNMGKGYAIRTGMKHFLENSSCEYLIFLDGDGQHNPRDIPKFILKFEENPDCDIVVASRFGTDEWIKNMPFPRKLSNLLSRFGLWILYNGLVISDPQNGYRAYRRRAVDYVQFKTNGYQAETEILIESYLMGLSFETVKIQSIYEDSHKASSKFSLLFDTWKIPGIMMKLFFKRKPWLLRNPHRKLYYKLNSVK
ncbi:MAG: glycosyltransferase family 2 protein [Candidatus Kariarchaeaceae archaeon]|jgi:glycosyltransferase involved in cell wall biosynthesis